MKAANSIIRLIVPLIAAVLMMNAWAQSSTEAEELNEKAQEAVAAGDNNAAAEYLEQALATWQGAHDGRYLMIKFNLAMVYFQLGRETDGRRLVAEVDEEGTKLMHRAREDAVEEGAEGGAQAPGGSQ